MATNPKLSALAPIVLYETLGPMLPDDPFDADAQLAWFTLNSLHYGGWDGVADELEGWVAAESAPALVYHLLGDLHRRMGNGERAADYYRAAVNRL